MPYTKISGDMDFLSFLYSLQSKMKIDTRLRIKYVYMLQFTMHISQFTITDKILVIFLEL
ncbi:hypothetical protein CBE01nite_40000 [Clostridium beijerinckii]|nr:hypothetical protein CBE01nite_40000 [Clostridium beijerinckii]